MTEQDSSDGGGSTPLQERMITAGLEILDRDGLGLGVESITYARVLDHLQTTRGVRVTRASIHKRIWASHDDFRREVLALAVDRIPAEVSAVEDTVLAATVRSIAERGLTGPERIAEFARIAGHDLFQATLHAPGAMAMQSIKALAGGVTEAEGPADTIQTLIDGRVRALLARRSERFADVAAALRLQVRPELGLGVEEASALFYTMAINLFVGGSLNHNAGCEEIAEQLGPSKASDAKPWTTATMGLRALLDFLFESDGDVTTDAASSLRPPIAPPLDPGEEPTTEPQAPGGRRTREQLRGLVLTAGVEVLLRDGLNLQPESLKYASVLAHIKEQQGVVLFRSSVHNRLWSSNEEYWLDVMTRGIEPVPKATSTADDTEQLLSTRSADGPSTITMQEIHDLVRYFVPVQIDDLLQSRDHVRFQQIKAALANHRPSPAVDTLKKRVSASHHSRIDRYKAAIHDYLIENGFEVRPGPGLSADQALEAMTVLSLASTTGAIFDQMAGVQASTLVFRLPRTDEPDKSEEWTPPAVAVRAFFEGLFQEKAPA